MHRKLRRRVHPCRMYVFGLISLHRTTPLALARTGPVFLRISQMTRLNYITYWKWSALTTLNAADSVCIPCTLMPEFMDQVLVSDRCIQIQIQILGDYLYTATLYHYPN